LAIAKSLPEVDPRFIQECPLCKRMNRIVMHGLHDGTEKHPDMGYSFCNCKNIFYTRRENVTEEILPWPDDNGVITYPDPFFAWPDPYAFKYWDVRRYKILWDLHGMCDLLREDGYEVLEARRDFDLDSKTPQHFHIRIKL
jgi:hypothetical protein